ncbi:MAG: prepilin-type N-terminal cleavage/methylation domain-containing protein, partial [Elusimicrobia bacterium]|nr:prepilin-type N-terminal cleavage/methylation domain-containing protein [Elusimicrobiota bacterium]
MKSGFTLIELLVVVLIIGILAGIAVPYYLKAEETSKANQGAALANMVAAANRMYAVDNPGQHAAGLLS